MIRRLFPRAVHLVGVLLGVSLVVYMMLELLPGDPAEVIIASSTNPTDAAVEELREQLRLNDPLPVRYFAWMGNALQGDLGQSYRTGQEITSMIGERIGVTMLLIIYTEIIALAIAVPLAVRSAQRRDSTFDRVGTAFTFGLQSIPNFVLILLLMLLFAVQLGWLPATGYRPISDGFTAHLRTMIIPALALAGTLIPVYVRVLRNDMIRTLQEDYILMARAQGLPPTSIVFKTALRPSLPTLVTVIGLNIGTLVGGTVIVELISGLPGVGTLIYTAITNRDYLVVQGAVLIVATAYVTMNFVVDILYTMLDPRVKL